MSAMGERAAVWQALLLQLCAYAVVCRAEMSSYPPAGVLVTGDGSNALLHLAVDTDTGQVYVGAVNSLLQLDSDLHLVAQATTGPAWDNPDCIPPYDNKTTCSSSISRGQKQVAKQLLNNANMVLVVDGARNDVITCGSLFQGTCQLRSRSNISVVLASYDTSADQQYFVAANDPTLSTVAFLGGGPSSAEPRSVLYTATSINKAFYVAHGSYAIASRLLDSPNAFELTNFDALRLQGTYLSLSPLLNIPVTYTYKSGLFYQGYSYFIAQSTSSLSNVVTSRIARICQYDTTFSSYIDMPLTCVSSSYNYVTAATVYTGAGYLATMLGVASSDAFLFATFTNQQTSSGVVCAFAFTNVTNNLNRNIQQCLQGSANTGDLFGNKPCLPYQPRATFSCENPYTQTYPPTSGSTPLAGLALFNSTSNITAVAVDMVTNITVLFLGTADGHLRKVFVDSNGAAEYDDVPIEPDIPVNTDMVFSANRQYVYLATARKVYKVPVETCASQQTAQSCLSLTDPYCGWCTLENRCSRMSNCSKSAQPLRWLPSLGPLTFDLLSISGRYLSVLSSQQVQLQFTSLPPVQSGQPGYVCQFVDLTSQAKAVSMATVSNYLVTCPMPANISALLYNSDHTDLQLSLVSMETGQVFYSTNVTLYKCSSYSVCSQCTQTPYSCQWCSHDNRCRDSSSSCVTAGAVTTVQTCPTIVSVSPLTSLIPAGVATTITVRATNLPQPTASEGYQCRVGVGALADFVPAAYINSTMLVCAATAYQYSQPVATLSAPVAVVWNGSYVIETSTYVQVVVYKCELLASDCSTCLSQSILSVSGSQYNCAWCSSTNSCSNTLTCLSSATTCPAPVVTSVSPLSGPVDGGTLVTLQGTNLGSAASAVTVTIGGVPCTVVNSLYLVSKQVVCNTSAVARQLNASIQVTVNAVKVSVDIFQYKDPRLVSLYPTKGPLSGGTLLTISGTSLSTGNNIAVSLAGLPCTLTSVTDSHLTCLTSGAGAVANTRTLLTVTFDSATRTLPVSYEYTEDPVLLNISPLASISSGGRNITVDGWYLDNVLQPTLALSRDGHIVNSTVCQVLSPVQLQCDSPAVPVLNRRRRQAVAGSVYTLSLIMDGVQCTRNITVCYPNISAQFTVYPDPVYDVFPGGTMTLNGQLLGLSGRYLNLASTLAETSVLIGQQECVLKSMDEKSLYCMAPSSQPPGLASDGTYSSKILPVVTVRVGNVRASLGTVQYQSAGTNGVWIIIVAVLGGVLVVVVCLVLVVILLQRRKAASRYRKMQVQLDTLESNVRNECKQAFAELQTDVSDLTSDLSRMGIPFWDFRTYMFKVLFPLCKDHPILHNSNMMTQFGSYSQGLSQFNQLLCHKTFLVTFIHTLEQQQRDFTIKDKASVASLLTVILQDKMEYATEILTTLLTELIDRSMEKKQPKLMLRRMESVVEKFLANWMSVCLYAHLKKQAGKSLFMLNKAIKQQTEKGPIDAITADARYSLSEDKLLREKIEPKTLLVTLVRGQGQDTVPCRLLDCDTISQAKEKALDAMYLNIPASSRPSALSRDLVWRKSGTDRVVLHDEDQLSTRQLNGYKRLNTLATYGLRDGAVLALVTRTEPDDMVTGKHGEIELSDVNAPIIKLADDGLKVWHLVKPEDGGHVQQRDHRTTNNNNNNNKVISEIFLTRLLTTKMTLQQYIDDVFQCILRADGSLPPAIKYIFDFFDAAARRHGVTDSDIVHTWKSNSLLLRFWVNIIKNPEFVFDMNKSTIVDRCLSVIAQTFMDSCSTAEHRLGKDSPSNKLLFAKDIPRYRQQVAQFYAAVHDAPTVSDQDMAKLMTELSMTHSVDLNVSVALTELYKFARKYRFELVEALEDSPAARKLQLASHFEQVLSNIEELSVRD